MQSPLSALSRALLSQADPGLLDQPLDGLDPRLVEADARELLRALFEAGEGLDLRELLSDDRLARWAEQTCTTREEEALARQLRRWLGAGGAGADDPERLVRVPPPPTGPARGDASGQAAALRRWAREHGVAELLGRRLAEVLPDDAEHAGDDALVEDACLDRARQQRPSRSLLADAALSERARAFLHRAASARAATEARRALHAAPLPSGPIGPLARRLRAVFADVPPARLSRVRFVPVRRVAVERDTGVAAGVIVAPPAEPAVQVRLFLSGFEQRALEGRCSACAAPDCVHRAALAARLYEACLVRDDSLHASLQALVNVPSWQRFLHALVPEAERVPEGAGREQVAFTVRLAGEQLEVGALVQRTLGDGRLSAGKLTSPVKLARGRHASDRDREVLSQLGARTRTLGAQHVPVDVSLLRALAEHPRVLLEGPDGARVPVQLVEERVEIALHEQPDGLLPRVRLAGAPVAGPPQRETVRYLLHLDARAGRLSFAPLTPELTRLLAALATFRGVLPPESYPQVAAWLAALSRVARVEQPAALEGLALKPPSRLLLRITPRFDEGVDLALSVRALPLAPLWAPGHGPELVHGLLDGKPCTVRRDLARERATAATLRDALDLGALMEPSPHRYRVETNQAALALLDAAARQSELLELEWAERRGQLRVTGVARASDLKVGLFKNGDFCALSGGVQVGDQLVAIDRLLEAARTHERFVPVGGGDYLEIARDLRARLADAQLCTVQHAHLHTLPSAALPRWLERLGEHTEAADGETDAWLARVRSAQAERGADLAIDPALAPHLRGYQQEGARWLMGLARWAPGACLADEMGLGKTIQTLALLLDRAPLGTALVVAPTSLVDNWLAELGRFAPGLAAHAYRGAAREAVLAARGPGVVLVTSFELLLRDRALFDDVALATLVVDEAQALRNARTKRARAALSLDAGFRLALSGTPIENRLGDLWSVFQLIAPGLLGSWARFRARFAVPIERYENSERAEALRGLIAPFLLRRTKREVTPELPPRTETVHLVTLSRAERDLYDAALVHARRALGKRKRSDDGERTVQILAQLTMLRQLACHPRLVLEDARVGSSKLAALTRILDDLLPRGHRVLIFSQFTRHLALVREALDGMGVAHVTLDGSTPPRVRRERVEAFQAGHYPVFLISLKAGGTGLNLTAADYVVHLDPWWNPSSEDQASDRAHRIGQDRAVTVIKLVSEGTIEERVLALHAHKRRLSGSVLADDASATAPDLAQLEALLVE